MTNKLVAIINSLKYEKLRKFYYMKWNFLYQITAAQNPWVGGYHPQIPILFVLCPQLNLLNPPPEQNSWVRHWSKKYFSWHMKCYMNMGQLKQHMVALNNIPSKCLGLWKFVQILKCKFDI